jgi:hypothetical protein
VCGCRVCIVCLQCVGAPPCFAAIHLCSERCQNTLVTRRVSTSVTWLHQPVCLWMGTSQRMMRPMHPQPVQIALVPSIFRVLGGTCAHSCAHARGIFGGKRDTTSGTRHCSFGQYQVMGVYAIQLYSTDKRSRNRRPEIAQTWSRNRRPPARPDHPRKLIIELPRAPIDRVCKY